MATIKEQFAWKGPTATLANSASDVFDVFTNGHPFVVIEITASSSGTLDVDGLFGAEAIRPLRYYFFNDTVETSQDPGDTCAVLAAQDLIVVPTLGAKAIRFTVAAGTLAFRHCACPSDAISGWLLMKLIDGGVTATVSGVLVDDAAFTPATSSVFPFGAFADETSPDSVNEGDVGAVRMTLDRRLRIANQAIDGPVLTAIDSFATAAINLTTAADQVLVSSAAGKQIWVYGFGISVGDAAGQTISFQDEDNVALSGIMEFAQYGGAVNASSGNLTMPLFKLGTDKDLEVDITGGDADGWITYAIWTV